VSNSRRARRAMARAGQPPEPTLRDWPAYSPQASSVLLRESADAAVLDPPTSVPVVEAVSNRPWSEFTQADYSPQQWRRACLIDTGRGDEGSKDRYALPVREPSGAVNRNGVHAAAGRLNQVDAPAEVKRKAARALVRLYRSDLDEDPPPRLLSLAGTSESTREHATVRETVPIAIREAPSGTPLTVDVQIIQAGWNKAGTRYYPPDMLARDTPKVFPAGTHMYLDHQTVTEAVEQPERSVTRLAAVLAEAPYTTDGGRTMRAKARVFAPHRQFLAEAWQDIGVSIDGEGDGQWGERDGRHGLILDSLTCGRSIDFVTKAGAGGRILQLLEAAVDIREARNVGAWLESRIHAAFTNLADEMYGDGRLTREERITLSSAIGEALKAFTTRVDTDAAHLYSRDLFDDPAPAGEATEVREAAPEPPAEPEPEPAPETTAPAAAPASPPADGIPPAATSTEEGVTPMSGANTQTGAAPATAGTAQTGPSPEVRAELAEARLREAEARVSELTTQNATLTSERDTARTELTRLRVTEAARSVVGNALAATDLEEAARTRITESVTANVPTTSDGQVDTNALTNRLTEAVERERTYIASILEARGAGRPNGIGGGAPIADPAQFRASLVESFKGLGMSDQAAQAAANGRVV
jgi:hypothetical protein